MGRVGSILESLFFCLLSSGKSGSTLVLTQNSPTAKNWRMLQNPIGDADSEGSIEHKLTRGLSQKTVCVYAICSRAYLASHLCFLAVLQNEFGIIILDQSFWHRGFCKCALPRCHHNFDRMTKFRANRQLPLFPWLSTDLLNWVKVKWSPGVASCSPLIKTTSLFARGAWLWWWCRGLFFFNSSPF